MLGYYIVLFVILLAFEYAYYLLAKKLWIVDRPHHQSSHRGIVVRGGGIVFYVAYLLWSIVNGFSWYGGLIGLTILVIISFIDDIHDVSPKIRLICQFIAIVLMFYHSGLIRTNPHVILILSIACVGTVNRNLIHFCDSSLLVFMILSLVVFNLFNFRRQAKCFAGDVGALAIGFILVYLVLRLCLRGQSMSWIAMSSVYLVDGGMTILHRILLRENLIKPHKEHAYQIMANELKMPHLVVSGIYMGLQAICCAVYIAWPGYPAFFAIFGVLIVMYLAFMKKYYHLHRC